MASSADNGDGVPEKDPGETARTAGRGGLAITFAKVYFILQGLVQQVLLPRVLGLDGYGALSSVLSAASVAYNPIVTTSIQGVSRAVVQAGEADGPAAARRTFQIHAGLAIVAAVAFELAVPSMTAFMRAPHLGPALQAVGLVLLCYGLYSPIVGVLNGRRRFVAQATFDVIAATVRTVALLVCGYLFRQGGHGVEGAVFGFVGVSALVFLAALAVVGTGRPGPGGPTLRAHLTFIAPLFAAQVLLNLLLQADMTLLRRFAGEAAVRAGLAVTAADPFVGAYRATQLYAFLPYQLLVSVTFILFPMLAQADREGDRAAVARYVAAGVRVAFLVSGLLVSVTSGLAARLLRFVYSEQAAELGARPMQFLTIGFGAFAILGVLTAVLSSLGRERAAAGVTALAFALVVVLCFLRARGSALGEPLLLATALSTSTGLVCATIGAAVLVRRTAGAVVRVKTVLRTAGCAAVSILVARFIPETGRLWTPVASVAVASIYGALLLLTGELGRDDLAAVRAIVSRRAKR